MAYLFPSTFFEARRFQGGKEELTQTSEDQAKVAKETYDDLKRRLDKNSQEYQEISNGISVEGIGEVVRRILDGILGKIGPDVVVDAKEDLVNLGKECLVGITGGIIGFLGGVNGVQVLRRIIFAILGKVGTGDNGEIVVAGEELIKLAKKCLDNSTVDIVTAFEEVKVVEEDVKNTNIKCRLKLTFKSIEAASDSFSVVKKASLTNVNKEAKEDDFAQSIRQMQAARKVRRDHYRGVSANDFPQFHRQIFGQSLESLNQGEEDLAQIEQDFQDDATFDVAKWTNECFGNSTARVPLYARGKDTKHSPVHLVQDLECFHLILSLYFFFKNVEKIESGGLIFYLEKFGLILYFNFLQKIYM
jgi:hypothetical protein